MVFCAIDNKGAEVWDKGKPLGAVQVGAGQPRTDHQSASTWKFWPTAAWTRSPPARSPTPMATRTVSCWKPTPLSGPFTVRHDPAGGRGLALADPRSGQSSDGPYLAFADVFGRNAGSPATGRRRSRNQTMDTSALSPGRTEAWMEIQRTRRGAFCARAWHPTVQRPGSATRPPTST